MTEYLAFAQNHPLLIGAALALLVIIAISEIRRTRRPWREAEPAEAVRLINAGAQLVDLRGHDAWRAGHIINARHIPLDELADKAARLDTDQPVLVYCDTGVTGGRAAALLAKQGFTAVWQLHGGLAAWKRENLPVAKS